MQIHKKSEEQLSSPVPKTNNIIVANIIVGIDNGTSGSIAIIYPDDSALWFPTPIMKTRNYQKHEKNITRVDTKKLIQLLDHYVVSLIGVGSGREAIVLLERPYANPGGFNASLSAARALEATLIALEHFNLLYHFEDSKGWQSVMLPIGTIGRDELKKASYEVGKKLFPDIKFKKDADSLLMALWAKRKL